MLTDVYWISMPPSWFFKSPELLGFLFRRLLEWLSCRCRMSNMFLLQRLCLLLRRTLWPHGSTCAKKCSARSVLQRCELKGINCTCRHSNEACPVCPTDFATHDLLYSVNFPYFWCFTVELHRWVPTMPSPEGWPEPAQCLGVSVVGARGQAKALGKQWKAYG